MLIRIASGPKSQIEKPAEMRYRSREELAMRAGIEAWGRDYLPGARCIHELVVGRGDGRCDMAFVAPEHLVAIEIKSDHDNTTRLMHQLAMFSLCAPELWLCLSANHIQIMDMVQFLLPCVGVLSYDETGSVAVARSAMRREPFPTAALSLLWVKELHAEAIRHRLLKGQRGQRPSHTKLVDLLVERLMPVERMAAICRQLRARDAYWRCDPPIPVQEP